jgi:LmbE family N-acetylglucosaminyl deacetylase
LLVERIREFKPQVVVTFASDGAMNTHPDHTMVSAFTCAAYHWAASEKRYPQLGPIHYADRLYLLTTAFFMEGRPAPMPAPWTVELDIRHLMARKQEAFRQHTSQAPLMEKTKEMFARYGQAEHYLLAAVREPQPQRPQTGFFDGLSG